MASKSMVLPDCVDSSLVAETSFCMGFNFFLFIYRSSYPDADQKAAAGEGEETAATLKPQELIDDGFELVLPSGQSISSTSLKELLITVLFVFENNKHFVYVCLFA